MYIYPSRCKWRKDNEKIVRCKTISAVDTAQWLILLPKGDSALLPRFSIAADLDKDILPKIDCSKKAKIIISIIRKQNFPNLLS